MENLNYLYVYNDFNNKLLGFCTENNKEFTLYDNKRLLDVCPCCGKVISEHKFAKAGALPFYSYSIDEVEEGIKVSLHTVELFYKVDSYPESITDHTFECRDYSFVFGKDNPFDKANFFDIYRFFSALSFDLNDKDIAKEVRDLCVKHFCLNGEKTDALSLEALAFVCLKRNYEPYLRGVLEETIKRGGVFSVELKEAIAIYEKYMHKAKYLELLNDLCKVPKTIKSIMIDKDLKVKDLANKLGINERVLSNKLYRDTFSLDEYIKIANVLGCDVKTIARDNNKEYLNDAKENK